MPMRRRKKGTLSRCETITIRVTPWEKTVIHSQARALSMSVGAYLVWSGIPQSVRDEMEEAQARAKSGPMYTLPE